MGGWLTLVLERLGATVHGLALPPSTNPNLFELAQIQSLCHHRLGDIRNLQTVKENLNEFDGDILLHLAAQPLVRQSYLDPIETYSTNLMGTVHVLEAVRKNPHIRTILVVTSDKCYENIERDYAYKETDPMGGYDPYSCSKGATELIVNSYRRSFFGEDSGRTLISVRAGNIIGGGDWAHERLVPDLIQALKDQRPLVLRNPQATRPWQHVLEPISAYLKLLEAANERPQDLNGPYNIGPRTSDCWSVRRISHRAMEIWGTTIAIETPSQEQVHEAHFLKLNCHKIEQEIHWRPRWHIDKCLQSTIEWYKAVQVDGHDAREICRRQIDEFFSLS